MAARDWLHEARADWGATRNRMMGRYDVPTNFERRARPTRETHSHHHDKTYRMAK